MEIEELRIGNWVAAGVQNVTIRGIHSYDVLDHKIKWHVYVGGFVGDYYCFNPSQIEAIPLTPEILYKARFEMTTSGFLATGILKAGLRIGYYNGNNSECSLFQFGIEFPLAAGAVKWLHQLQNLYFALAGNELEINL